MSNKENISQRIEECVRQIITACDNANVSMLEARSCDRGFALRFMDRDSGEGHGIILTDKPIILDEEKKPHIGKKLWTFDD